MFPVEIKPNIPTIYGVCNLGWCCKSYFERNVERIDQDTLMNYIPNLKGNKGEMTHTVHRETYNTFLVRNNN